MAAGLAFAAPGFLVFAFAGASMSFTLFALGTFVFALGFAPLFTLTTDLIVGSAPPERAGAASAISETSGEFGGALGIAIFGSIGVAVYRTLISDAIPPDLPAAADEAARATLGGAVNVASGLPAATASALLSGARDAFVQGMRLVAVISVVGSLGLALFAALVLRRVRPSSGAPVVESGTALADVQVSPAEG
jgi:DHA2 family multidrug resistance protein-like MFS transporter